MAFLRSQKLSELNPEVKRIMIEHLKADYSVALICKTLGVSRSFYYTVHNAKEGDKTLVDAIDQVLLKWRYYGYRRVTHE